MCPIAEQTLDRIALRVLAVEDDPADAARVDELLSRGAGDYDVVQRADIDSALEELTRNGADCVLLGAGAGDAQGLEALAKVRAVAGEIPVIVLAGQDDPDASQRAAMEGANDLIARRHLDHRLLSRSINYAVSSRRVEAELAFQALHDPLTGLPNRALFLMRLAQALVGPRACPGVLLLDLDRFRVINDSLGHDAGDRLLVMTAERITAAVRPGDVAARFGGDEFVILCESLSGSDEALQIARRIDQALAEPFLIDGEKVFLRASVGVALGDGAEHGPEELIRDADAAMNGAKEHGGGMLQIFDGAMRVRAVERLQTENALYHALARDELTLHYQPQFDLADGRLCGAEALVRWNHPDRGLLGPDKFIAAAEDTGLIVELGAWVLEAACHHAAEWKIKFAVNVSARQMATPGFVERVQSILDRTGADPALLCLELTETSAMRDDVVAGDVLGRLKQLGLSLAVDDFGTGYSSLALLQQLPFDIVKIDRSFVTGIDGDNRETSIVAAVIDLAHALELQTVAEGVERSGQPELLRSMGCDLAQGFLLGEPEPAVQFAARLHRGA